MDSISSKQRTGARSSIDRSVYVAPDQAQTTDVLYPLDLFVVLSTEIEVLRAGCQPVCEVFYVKVLTAHGAVGWAYVRSDDLVECCNHGSV